MSKIERERGGRGEGGRGAGGREREGLRGKEDYLSYQRYYPATELTINVSLNASFELISPAHNLL